MKQANFLIYGANGYTGRLITELAVKNGLKPILGGRNEQAIKEMAAEYELDYEICDLADRATLDDMVLGVNVVLHCAGPFSRTAKPMLKSCLRNKTHYLDITGEIEVFELLARHDEEAKEAEIMVLPGVGFDVVPSDCLALYLKEQLPSATHLTLAFMGTGGVSHGTATTMLENIHKGGAIREEGKIKVVPSAYKTKKVPFRHKKVPTTAVTIPWGDVSTAFYSTGIPNIEVYMGANKTMIWGMGMMNNFKWFIGNKWVKNFLQTRLDNSPAGPSVTERQKGKAYLWGEVSDMRGNVATARITTPEGYTLTAMAALHITKKALQGNAPIGFQTPAKAYGADLIMELSGVVREDIGRKRKIKVE